MGVERGGGLGGVKIGGVGKGGIEEEEEETKTTGIFVCVPQSNMFHCKGFVMYSLRTILTFNKKAVFMWL